MSPADETPQTPVLVSQTIKIKCVKENNNFDENSPLKSLILINFVEKSA